MYKSVFESFKLGEKIPGCTDFAWKEALFLPKWEVYCFPTLEQSEQIVKIGQALQQIRTTIGKKITITSWLRPKNYNIWHDPYGVGGAQSSAHMLGSAVDFVVIGMSANDARTFILPDLEMLNIRMENLPGSSWVHIDAASLRPGGNRFFAP